MIARTQHIRHGHILKDFGPREVRILQQARRKTFVVSGFLFSHEAGDEPGRGLHQHHGGGLPAVEHCLAHADLLDRQNVHEPGVDAFIPAAHQRQRLFPRQLAGQRLRERAYRRAASMMIRPAPPRSVSSSRKVFTSGSSIMTMPGPPP